MLRSFTYLMLLAMAVAPSAAGAAPPPGTEPALRRAVDFLKIQVPKQPSSGEAVLGALALVKADHPVDSPEVQAIIAAIQKRCEGEKYAPHQHHYYVAGLEMMLLEAVEPGLYRPEMEKILTYILAGQLPTGSWYYPNQQGTGDTSITQYSALGMWAAERAGLDVPREAWDKMAAWHLKTQNQDGGFGYHPDERDWMNRSLPALTLGGAANILLARMHLFPDAERREAEKQRAAQLAEAGTKFGVLETVDLSATPEAQRRAGNERYTPTSRPDAITRSVDRAAAWSAARFVLPPSTVWRMYFLYGLERMAALGNMATLGEYDWYPLGCQWLVENQTKDGAWTGNHGTVAGTAFGVLFLTRSTSKMIGRSFDTPELGGGLLAGGRGLPTLQTISKPKQGKGETSPLDDLLARLADAKAADVPGVQQAVLEAVRFGDREALIAQQDRLRKLVNDPRAEVRRTAFWALGRGGDLNDVPALIKGLSDADVGVAIEANNALCVLSRRPLAFGIPGDPLTGVPENATDEVRTQALDAWRKRATDAWKAWYERVAPYERRDGHDQADGLGAFR